MFRKKLFREKPVSVVCSFKLYKKEIFVRSSLLSPGPVVTASVGPVTPAFIPVLIAIVESAASAFSRTRTCIDPCRMILALSAPSGGGQFIVFIGFDDLLNERVTDDIAGIQRDKADTVHVPEDCHGYIQARPPVRGQVLLRGIASDHGV